jgi:transposase InsO family protein
MRRFGAPRPNRKWVANVTEFSSAGRKLYVSRTLGRYNGENIADETSRRPLLDEVNTMLRKAFAQWQAKHVS